MRNSAAVPTAKAFFFNRLESLIFLRACLADSGSESANSAVFSAVTSKRASLAASASTE
jgi:hypothetical protein